MSTHFKWYPATEETIVPWNARYPFPSQANKAVKMTPRIPPKSGSTFSPSQVVRIEFPAQGYVNPLNTTLEFDVTLVSFGTTANETVRFQNNIQSLFSRVRLLYGATPLEDMINYNVVVRALTEWSSTNQNACADQTSIAEGIGGIEVGFAGTTNIPGLINVRQQYIQGIDKTINTASELPFIAGDGPGVVPNSYLPSGVTVPVGASYCTRRYQINFALGLFTQDKLVTPSTNTRFQLNSWPLN